MLSGIKRIKKDIDVYLEKILEATSHLEDALADFLAQREDSFLRHVDDLTSIEHDLDEIRRGIIEALYKKMLIPESRGDILGLLEHLDDVANFSKIFARNLKAERPEFPKSVHEELNRITAQTRKGVSELIDGVHAYFENKGYLAARASQVSYYEREVDELTFTVTAKIFQDNKLDLARKTHLRHILERLDRISDTAEDVSERMVISSLKREI